MPAYLALSSFWDDWERLDARRQQAFLAARRDFVDDLRNGGRFRKGLRVKGVRGYPGVYEMTWAGDGRATWMYGTPRKAGEPHIVWRRIGTHSIFGRP